jgi:uncharacterized membrane protein YhiD involved in acid resistance
MGRVGWELALSAILLAFATSMVIASVYTLTYRGIGYLRSFTQTIALSGMVAALVMLAIGDDIARGLGMVGALTLIRFRTTLKDTRDLVFVFASLAVGVACGVQAFAVAVLGTLTFALAAGYLAWSDFGSRQQFDAVLRFRAPREAGSSIEVSDVLARHCRKISLIDVRASGDEQELAYHLKFQRPGREPELIRELSGLDGVQDAALFTQDGSLEL